MPGRLEGLRVLLFDGDGHLFDRPDHCPQGFANPDAVDRAEQLEEFPLHLAEESDQAGRHAALHGIAFEILDGVQADLLVQQALELPAGIFGDQHLVLERARGKGEKRFRPTRPTSR